jgi:hypothetical protein
VLRHLQATGKHRLMCNQHAVVHKDVRVWEQQAMLHPRLLPYHSRCFGTCKQQAQAHASATCSG